MNFSTDSYSTNGNLKKRVLFVITQSDIGGAQRFLYNLLTHLEPENYDVLVAVGSDGGGEFVEILKSAGITRQILKSLKREIGLFHDLRAVSELRNLIKLYRPDTLFLNSSKAGFIGALASVFPKKIKNLKVIYRIGGWTFNDPWPKCKKILWITLEKISARWKDIIIVNNLNDFEQAKKLKIRPRRELVLIHNGIDVYKTNFLPREEARLKLFERASRTSGKIFQVKDIIGTIANFYPTKGLEYLIEAAVHFKNNDEMVFVIIGSGELKEKFELRIQERGLDKKVLLVGQIPDAFTLLSAFDIFVLPSVKEGFPWALIEAMSAKLPVIATNVGAIPEIIEDRKNGLVVQSNNPDELALKIKEVLESDHLRKELGIQAHQTVLFKFELDKMVKKIEALL